MAERHYFSVLESRFVFYDDACDAHIETRVSGGGTMAEPSVDRHWSVAEARKQYAFAQESGVDEVISYMSKQLEFALERRRDEQKARKAAEQDTGPWYRLPCPDPRLPSPPRREAQMAIPPELALLLNPDIGRVAHVSRQAEEATRQAEQMAEEATKMRQQAEQTMAEAKAMMQQSTAQLKAMEELAQTAAQPRAYPVATRTRPRTPAADRGRRFRFDEED